MKEKRKRIVPFWKKLFYLCIFSPLAKGFTKFVLLNKVRRDKEVKKLRGGYLILSTHVSRFDFISVAMATWPKYFAPVVARKMMNRGFQASIFRTFDGIPKHQYIADLACIKKIRQYIDAGECVLMCPEGKVTMDGRNGFLSASVAKLIKWLKVPVVFVHTHGSALTFPKWAVVGGFRRGECVTESRVLFTAEQTVSLSEDEIYEKLSAAFTFNDYEYQDVNNIKFKTKIPAMGISGLLYKCPKCNSEYVNTTDSHMIKCSECGNTAIIDVYGRITAADDTSVAYDRPDRWVDFQKAEIEKEIEAPDFCLTEDVVLYIEDDISASYIKRAAGKLFLSREGIRFKVDEYFIGEGFYNDEIFYPIQNLATLGPEYDDIFLTSGNKTYQYAFAGKNRTYRWTWTTEAIHRMLFHNDREY